MNQISKGVIAIKKQTCFGLALLITLLGFISVPRRIHSQAASPHGVLISWTASTTPGVTYNVYRAPSTGGMCGAYVLITSNVTGTSYGDLSSGLSNSTSYCYEVDAMESGALSGPSNVATITTPATWPSNPLPPSGCTATAQ